MKIMKKTNVIVKAIVVALTMAGFCFFAGCGTKSAENAVKKEIEKQVLEALGNGTIHDLMTPDFKAADEAVGEVEAMFGEVFHDADIFYGTQDEVPEGFNVSEVIFEGKDKASVKVMLVYWFNHELVSRDSIVLTMVRDDYSANKGKKKWLVDDVMSFYINNGKVVSFSQKAAMNDFVDEQMGARAYAPEEDIHGSIESWEKALSMHHFIGQIAGADVHVSMKTEGSMVQGRYYYDSQRTAGNMASMAFYGNSNGNDLKLTELVNNKVTGLFEGKWNNGVYEGTFTRTKDEKKFTFKLVETEGGTGFFSEDEIVVK